ncbi:MAG TPA: S16 family serine protease [Ornithinimicrobium sp.]|uniref:YlbL family protein n=1 Tax=Ornithinimicrobium sp. TaxID=1977084 RepID=UPI002B45900F|nr:S16 family serine protease [Ornithinimicrobium sp.]HKJ13153.1 S16 family serine protease [Ornithinimicrobium sp.]
MTQPLFPPAHTGISRRAALVLVSVVVAVAVVAVLNLVHVEKVIYRPGPAYDTLGEIDGTAIVEVEGLPTYPTSGTLDFTTITLNGGPRFPVSAWEWMTASLDPSSSVADEHEVFPDNVTASEVREQNLELMTGSQQQAAVVALRAIGEKVPEEVKVAQVLKDAPADGVLKVNDRIMAVGDTSIRTPDDLRAVLQEVEPGGAADFTIERDGEQQRLEVPTTRRTSTEEDGTEVSRTIIGIYPASDFDLPYDVSINAGKVGGPSAGLMFTLAVYDTITPGELTGGRDFAGTGTISSDGEIGPIGGIQQKMIAADRAGADYFLAPSGNCGEVAGHVPEGLKVAGVATFDEAREVVEAVGKDPDAPLPAC